MILPGERDETLEWAARRIEDYDVIRDRGPAAVRGPGERKDSRRLRRAAEDAALEEAVTRQVRARCAAELRSFLGRPGLSALDVLERLASLPEGSRHDMHLRDAWPLAFGGKGWVNIDCIVRCDSNCIPPETQYRIRLTDKGRIALKERRASHVL